MSAGNLENLFNKMNEFINIDKDRKEYSVYYEFVRNVIFKQLRTDPVFSKLCKGFELWGSYGDNLKVNKPDEYDLVFFLKLPESSKIVVTRDTKMPGNIFLNLKSVLETIKNQKQHEEVYKRLLKSVNAKNQLIVEHLQAWLDSCMRKALNVVGGELVVNNNRLNLLSRRCGPAHTMYINGCVTFSVDFVPAIKLDKSQSVLTRKLRHDNSWEAIPKPVKRSGLEVAKENASFRASYYTAEKELMNNAYNLKNALRFLKKFRDRHQNLSNLKSYYIKTLFLWKLKEVNSSQYWMKSLNVIVLDMFKALEERLLEKCLPFYWDPDLNLFSCLSATQLIEMQGCVVNARKTLVRASMSMTEQLRYNVASIFLTSVECDRADIRKPFPLAIEPIEPIEPKTTDQNSWKCSVS